MTKKTNTRKVGEIADIKPEVNKTKYFVSYVLEGDLNGKSYGMCEIEVPGKVIYKSFIELQQHLEKELKAKATILYFKELG